MSKQDVYIGKGKLAGMGVYANRDFKKGDVVIYYKLKLLNQKSFNNLPKDERKFVHSFNGKMYLFPEPSRYTNHSAKPNTEANWKRMCDVAIRPIKKGEMITTNATLEVRHEIETFIQAKEKPKKVNDFKWISGGYRNAVISYSLHNKTKKLKLKRINGSWQIL